MGRPIARLALGLGLAVVARPAAAQISPGELAEGHVKLEGSQNCLKCHDPKQGVSPAKCLECHEALKKRVDAGVGLHSRPEYGACQKCHVEHTGRKADLVWWGEKGIGAFDHALTGYALEGKHTPLKCDACHLPKLGKTFLGLKRDCVPCHTDVHKGQFGAKCASCHGQNAWKPVTGFDHTKTAYPLTGLHVNVGCDKCHPALPAAPASAEVKPQVQGNPVPVLHELPCGRSRRPARYELLLMPHDGGLEEDRPPGLRPRPHRLPTARAPRGRSVREVPRPR